LDFIKEEEKTMKGSYFVSNEDFQKAIQERDEAKKAYAETQRTNVELQEKYSLTKKELDEAKEKRDAIQAELDALQKELDETKKKAEAASKAKKTKDDEALADAKTEAEKAKTEAADLQKKLTAAEDEAKKAKTEAADLQKKLTVAEDEAKKAKTVGGGAKDTSALIERVKNAEMTDDEKNEFQKELKEARAHALKAGNILKAAEDRKNSDTGLLDLLGLGGGIF
jgi:chromosome segregation ATPase